jgi:hypothetical protein
MITTNDFREMIDGVLKGAELAIEIDDSSKVSE